MTSHKKALIEEDDNLFSLLPYEIFLYLALFLPIESKKTLRQTCTWIEYLINGFLKVAFKSYFGDYHSGITIEDLESIEKRQVTERAKFGKFTCCLLSSFPYFERILKISMFTNMEIHLSCLVENFNLSALDKLETLNFYIVDATENVNVHISGIPPCLESLKIQGDPQIFMTGDCSGLTRFRRIGKSRRFKISEILAQCKNLREIYLTIGDIEIGDLEKITKFRQFSLSNCRMTTNFKSISSELIRLQILLMDCCEKKREEIHQLLLIVKKTNV